MKSPRLLAHALSIVLLFALTHATLTPAEGPDAKQGAGHLGTWKLVSTKYGDATEFTPYPPGSSRIKLIYATHITWLEVAGETKLVLASAGGKYELTGNTYIETIEWAGEGMEPYLGKAQKFTIRVEGNKLFQSGELSTGLKLEENWERVK